MIGVAYVAAPWGEKPAGREIRDELVKRGICCSATWLDRKDDPYSCDGSEAQEDEIDLRQANRFVMLVPENDTSRGGRDTELGMAIALRLSPIHLIGKPKQVFHAHPKVTVFESIEEWKAAKW